MFVSGEDNSSVGLKSSKGGSYRVDNSNKIYNK